MHANTTSLRFSSFASRSLGMKILKPIILWSSSFDSTWRSLQMPSSSWNFFGPDGPPPDMCVHQNRISLLCVCNSKKAAAVWTIITCAVRATDRPKMYYAKHDAHLLDLLSISAAISLWSTVHVLIRTPFKCLMNMQLIVGCRLVSQRRMRIDSWNRATQF